MELKLLAERQYDSAVKEWPQQPHVDSSNMFTIVNPLAWARWAAIELPGGILDGYHSSQNSHCIDEDLLGPTQHINGKSYALVKLKGLSAMPVGQLTNMAKRPKNSTADMKATPSNLSNGIVDACFDKYGQLSSMTVHGEPLLFAKDEAAAFTLHDDNPEAYGEANHKYAIQIILVVFAVLNNATAF